jgi:hypothetical protein
MVPHYVSVVVRYHPTGKLDWLEEALFSLAVQKYDKLQVVLVVQQPNSSLVRCLQTILQKQPFRLPLATEIIDHDTDRGTAHDVARSVKHLILPVAVSDGVDGRSHLLNRGMQLAQGQYLAFLDYDDVVYGEIYQALITRLQSVEAAVAFGGTRLAVVNTMDSASSPMFIESKQPFINERKNKAHLLLQGNFFPIHSYVIDRSRVQPQDLYIDTQLSRLEDYEFLLRLAAKYQLDFQACGVPVAEYRFRTDGSNSTVMFGPFDAEKRQPWIDAEQYLAIRKQQIQVQMTIAELESLFSVRDMLG